MPTDVSSTVTDQGNPPPAGSQSGGVAELVAEHEKETLPPTPEAIDAELKRAGETLNPDEYQIREGKPALSKLTGKPKKKTGPKKIEVTAPAAEQPALELVAMGTIYTEMLFGACQTIFGPAWEPKQEQRQRITHAFGVYLKAKGMKDLPPEFMLASALLGYVADKPQIQAARAK